MKQSGTPHALRWNLAAVIALKIVFLCFFWQFVLKHQSTHITPDTMSARLLSPSSTPQDR